MVLVSHQENVSEACKDLGESILGELTALGLVSNGTITRDSNDMFDDAGKPLDYYAINRHCAARDIPGIIVEHCFMDNATDEQFIDSEEDLRALAKADAVGIANYFGLAAK
jgi:N-acetylmuramoyl-L-alanine amidase